jgi:DNA-directed RNA polymerase subunit RPC12/RpoP
MTFQLSDKGDMEYVETSSSIDGIRVFKPRQVPSEEIEAIAEFPCPQCGAQLVFDIAQSGLFCSHCGHLERSIGDRVGESADRSEFTLEIVETTNRGLGVTRRQIDCQNCGASITIPEDSLSAKCTFCGSLKIVQYWADQQKLIKPEYLIPFRQPAEKNRQVVAEWMVGSWFVPSGLRKIAHSAEFNSIYLPFWDFSMSTTADWKAEVGHKVQKTVFSGGEFKKKTVIVWRWENGSVERTFDKILIPATTKISSLLLNRINKFDFGLLVEYGPGYLAGHSAHINDIDLNSGWKTGRGEAREETRRSCYSQASTNRIRNFSMNLDYSDETWRYVLLPFYLTSYSYKQHNYQVLINGQNGEISGQRPVDWNKVWLLVLIMIAPGMFLGLLGLMTIPFLGLGVIIGIVGFILLVIGIIASVFVYQKASGLDDI